MIYSRKIIESQNANVLCEYFGTSFHESISDIAEEYRRKGFVSIDNDTYHDSYASSTKRITHAGFRSFLRMLRDNNITLHINYKYVNIYIEDRIFQADFKEDRFFLFPKDKYEKTLIINELGHIFKFKEVGEYKILQGKLN